jgi:transposase
MARYKHIDTNPKFLPVDLARQLMPGTFEHALSHLIDHELDLSGFDARYRNDNGGAPAYPPAMLLKIVLFAYSRGIVSSRGIEQACREHVTFMALSGDHAPHFTTIATFVGSLGDEIARIFAHVLYLCDRQGLIGREMFAIDGVKLPSNASKSRSGTRADFERQAAKLETAAQSMLTRHRESDERHTEPGLDAKEKARVERLQRDAAELRAWLAANPSDRAGASGSVRKSNRTDNESAKMATSKGVIQGYTGVAAVDSKHQIIVEAQAHGTGSEQELLTPIVAAIRPFLTNASVVTADAGYHSESNLRDLSDMEVDALVADNGMRKRDERFATQDRHKEAPHPLHDKSPTATTTKLYTTTDFVIDVEARTCRCPAGKDLYRTGGNVVMSGQRVIKFRGAQRDCLPCPLRALCLRKPQTTKTRQVAVFLGAVAGRPKSHTERMRERIDSPEGRALYGRRFATVEPVFGNIRHNKGLDRFTLRGRGKVDTQWKLFALVHNIEKLMNHGYANAA